MPWNGKKIKELLNIKKLSITQLATKLKISRQAINSWINGDIPRGHLIVSLCEILNVMPNDFFVNEQKLVTIPKHRTIRKTLVTDEMQQDSHLMAKM